MLNKAKQLVHEAFDVSIGLKALSAGLETLAGILLLIINPETINHWVVNLTQGELTEDPADKISNFLVHASAGLSANGEWFAALYLLSHGVIKLLLIVALFQKKLWAYPLAMVVFALFLAYQMYRYFLLGHSVWMLLLSILDVFVIALTYLEYRNLKFNN